MLFIQLCFPFFVLLHTACGNSSGDSNSVQSTGQLTSESTHYEMTMSGAGSAENSASTASELSQTERESDHEREASHQEQEEPEENLESVESEPMLEWSEAVYKVKDDDGYTFDIKIKASPWILYSNSDILNNAWIEIGNKKALPEFEDWNFRKDGNKYWRPHDYGERTQIRGKVFRYNMSDMYYCVGTISISNTTEGWGVSSDNRRSLSFNLNAFDYNDRDNWIHTLGKVYYGNSTKDTTAGLHISAGMESDKWQVPFVIMAPENFSPANPDGEYYSVILDHGFLQLDLIIYGGLSYEGENGFMQRMPIGIIGRDGVYQPPQQGVQG